MSGTLSLRHKEREELQKRCMANLGEIGKAILAYRADHGDEMPDWLSDLYPRYLADSRFLVCPADETGGALAHFTAYRDPKMPCSYLYDFNPLEFSLSGVAGLFDMKLPKDQTYKTLKTTQLKYFGNLVPVLRCFHHSDRSQVLDLTYGAQISLSSATWEEGPEAIAAVLSFLRQVIRDNPDSWEEEFSLKEIYTYFKDTQRLPDLQLLLEQSPNLSTEALRVLAAICESERQTDRAIENCREIITRVPDDVETRLRLAKLYATENNLTEARTETEQILQFAPNNLEAIRLLEELSAVSEASAILERFGQVEDSDGLRFLHYQTKLEEILSFPRKTRLSTIRKTKEILDHSFGREESVTHLSHLYRTLDQSLSAHAGVWETYTTSDGLINDYVHAICQDSRGLLWIGTGKGVCTYDGEHFTPFRLSEPLTEAHIWSSFIDRAGAIWFGTFLHGAFRYDGKNVEHYTIEDGLAADTVPAIAQDRSGLLWFACETGGISRYDGKVFTNFTEADGLASYWAITIMEDSQGRLWIGTADGVSQYVPSASPLDKGWFINFTEADGLAGNLVQAIAEDRQGNLWFGCDKGVSRYDGEAFTTFTVENGLVNSDITDILVDKQGNLWFTCGYWQPGQRISCYNGEKFISFTTQDGLSENSSSIVFEDREGNLWFGHEGTGGLSQLKRQGLRNYGFQDGLAGTATHTLASDVSGNLWIATDGGVSQYDGKIFTQPIADSKRQLGDVRTILADTKGHLWFGTADRGLIRYDGTRLTHFTTVDGLVGNSVRTTIEDKHGTLWIGSGMWPRLGGISRFDLDEDPGDGQAGKGFANLTMADGLAFAVVTALTEDDSGNIWIGTWGGGVDRYDGERFTHFTTADGLVDNRVSSIYLDPQDKVWIGTAVGLCQFDGTTFATVPQLGGKRVSTFLEDQSGNLWIGTANGGIIRTDGKVFTQLTTADRLSGNSIHALKEDQIGNIWIGTDGGLTKYSSNQTAPLIHVESVVADQVYNYPQEIVLPEGTKSLRINYKAVSFVTRPEAMQYFYQLEGHDADWQGPTYYRSIEYLDLMPGNYIFRVKAVSRDFQVSEPAVVSLSVTEDSRDQQIAELKSDLEQRYRELERLNTGLEAELRDARNVQMSLMPDVIYQVGDLEIFGRCLPSKDVSGDFFNYLEGKIEEEFGIVIADVMGKAMKGAMNAVMTDGVLNMATSVLETLSPGVLLRQMNTVLQRRMENEMSITMIIGLMNSKKKTLTLANAGHHAYPLLKRGRHIRPLKVAGMPLGMVASSPYREVEFALESGDVVVFMTDGIIEAEDHQGNLYAMSGRLERTVAQLAPNSPVEAMVEAVIIDVLDYSEGKAHEKDDMTVVVLRVK